jgi:hypothetical protein
MAAAAGGAAAAAAAAAVAAVASSGGASAAGRQIEAFTVQAVLDEKRVLCLESWSSYLLIGLAGGWAMAGDWRGRSPLAALAARSFGSLSAQVAATLFPLLRRHVALQMAPCC